MGDQRSPAITMVPRAHAAGLFCCGEADACWADQVRVGPNGEIIPTITDDRDDGPLKRMHEDIGNNISFHQTKSLKETVTQLATPSSFLVLLRYLAYEVIPDRSFAT